MTFIALYSRMSGIMPKDKMEMTGAIATFEETLDGLRIELAAQGSINDLIRRRVPKHLYIGIYANSRKSRFYSMTWTIRARKDE